MKLVILQREHGIRWDDIDVIADDRQTLVGHQHRHGRLLRQEFRQQTLVNRIQVLNHHIGLGGRVAKSSETASRPPAEAPMATRRPTTLPR